VGLLTDCSKLWEGVYKRGKVRPRSGPLLLGSAFDAMAERLLTTHWRGGWVTVEQAAYWFADAWDREMCRPEPVEWAGRNPATIMADGIALASAPATLAALRGLKLAPHPENPADPALQVRVELKVPGVSVPVVGYVDAIAKGPRAGDLHLIDFKTAGRRWVKGRERKELQARVYTGALWQSGVSFAHLKFAYWVFVPGLTPEACTVQKLDPLLSEGDVLQTMTMLARAWRQIKAGAFPGNPHAYACNPTCPCWSECFGP
jgi:hypothetical protein